MIRPAIPSDAPVLIDLISSFFANGELNGTGLSLDADTVEFFVQDCIELDEHCVLVAEVDGQVVGAIAGTLTTWWGNTNIKMVVERGWFIPKGNRRKYPMAAMSLRKRLRQWGKDNGATVIMMVSTVREESPRVKEMYEKDRLIHIDNNFIGPL